MFKSFPFNSRISLKENAENATASASKLVSPKPKPLEVKQVIVQHRFAHYHLFKGNLE